VTGPSAPPPTLRLFDEIAEQPGVAARLLEAAVPAVRALAGDVRERDVDLVVIAGRGTSDHAALYAQYVLGARHRLPVALATPSLLTMYGVEPRVERALVLGISQSGASPDIVAVLESARRQGAVTAAITNDPASPLAAAAAHVVDLAAGEERSVAATKTYTAELLAIAMLSAELGRDGAARADLAAVPAALAAALEAGDEASRIAGEQAGLDRAVVLGRGFGYATAKEWSLKLKELAQVAADPYSAADFAHGPRALVEAGSAVFLSVAPGPTRDALAAEAVRLRDESGADLLVLSADPDAQRLGRWVLPVPAGLPEWLEPIAAIVPAQLHAAHLALARGLDPEAPRGLAKVTLTR
jgi:glucosamine--fructose-6-phosphate aminotransferase (isomerizing)